MLSAFAARKAAKAATTQNVEAPSAIGDHVPPSSSKSRIHAKRKISSSSARPTQNKRRRSAKLRAELLNSSHNTPEPQLIDLGVESEDALSSDSYMSDGSVEASQPTTLARSRHWSPSAPVMDSSEDERPPVELREAPSLSPQQLSTFVPAIEQNFFSLQHDELSSLGLATDHGDAATALCLALHETVCFLGACSLVVIHGQVESSGAVLLPSRKSYRVYAPKSSHLPVFQCTQPSPMQCGGHPSPSDLTLLPPRLQAICQGFGAVILIQELRTGVEGLERVCGTFNGIFQAPPACSEGIYDLGLRGISMVIQKSRLIQPFTLFPSWSSALSSLEAPSTPAAYNEVCLVKGPKKTGKSTFAVTLVNRLLSKYCKVAFLECDIGQSEFSPVGMVALHVIDAPILGPPFTHPTLPYRAHFVGSTSPRSSPSYYLSAIQSLIDSYRQDIQIPGLDPPSPPDARIAEYIPLVVNTMGWVKGLGASLLESIEGIVQPTKTFEFEVHEFQSWREPLPSASDHTSPIKHQLEPVVSASSYNAADLRSLAMLSYFHAAFPAVAPENDSEPNIVQITAQSWDTRLPLCARLPYEVECPVAFDRVILVGAGAEDVVPSEIHRVLNGAIIALLTCSDGALEDLAQDDDNPVIPYIQNFPPPRPSASTCLGLALIRSISPDATKMQLITPIPPSMLEKCRVIVKGEVELPVWGLLDFLDMEMSKGTRTVPYLRWGRSEGIGGEKRRVRRNLMRRGQV